jgi:DNA-binding NtrC family response regulator
MDVLPTILIVDDEKDITDLLKRFLSRKKNFNIIVYNSGFDAINELKTTHIDILLSDVMMPVMSGLDLLKEAIQIQPDLKVIMMTAYSTMDKIIESEKLGAKDYVAKPFESLTIVEDKIISLLKD